MDIAQAVIILLLVGLVICGILKVVPKQKLNDVGSD